MTFTEKRKAFIDRTARKPGGKTGIKMYSNPKAHFKGFRIIMNRLNLSPQDEYFEIGCGGGQLLGMALERVKFAAAVDHSPDMAALATKNNQRHVKEHRAEILVGNAEHLPCPDNRFTSGASANMFFFVERPEKVLSEIYRVLQPGGRFALVTMGNGLLGKICFGWLYSLRTYSDDEMRTMLRNAGFSKIEVTSGYSQVCYAEKPL